MVMWLQINNKYNEGIDKAVTPIQVTLGGRELDPKRNLGVNEYRGPGEWYQRDLPQNSDSNCWVVTGWLASLLGFRLEGILSGCHHALPTPKVPFVLTFTFKDVEPHVCRELWVCPLIVNTGFSTWRYFVRTPPWPLPLRMLSHGCVANYGYGYPFR